MSANVKDYKREAAQQWTEAACGFIADPSIAPESAEYFAAVDSDRYGSYAPWLKDVMGFHRFRDKDVLEIGFGQGTDLMQFARAGARSVRGFDLSSTHLRLASRRFALAGIPVDLRLHDVEQAWPAPSESLDVVYSFGVLHHTPHPERAIAEAYRCLRPGGTILIGLYQRYSLFAFVQLYHWIRQGHWRHESYDESFWRIERPVEGTTARTLVDRYSPRESADLIRNAGFTEARTVVHHYGVEGTWPFSAVPPAIRDWAARHWGWYVITEATKPV